MRAVPPICIGLGKRIICQFLDGGDSSHLKEPASAPQRGYPPAAGPEQRQALFEPPQGGGEFGFSSPTFWAQKVGKNACPPEGESRLWRDRGRPGALHALLACGKRTSAPGAAFRCQAGGPSIKHRTKKENYTPVPTRWRFFPSKRTGFGSAAGAPTGCRSGTAPGLV